MKEPIDGQSFSIVDEKIAQLRSLFPEVFTEDKIDFKRLKDILGDKVSFGNEHYELSWAGKSEARKEVQKQTTATLIPDKESSINFDTSENIFIEGENLEVLRILQKSYFGKIKMIYIDPPYNTGNDSFVYPDDFSERQEAYYKRTGITDDQGFLNKQDLWKKNTKESGQFHSVWLSMMYPRLYLARNLLKEDGILFVSIDDNEVHNLRMLMNEVFGEENLLAQLIWRTDGNFDNQAKIKICHEYVLVYTKSINNFPHPPIIDPNTHEKSKLYNDQIRNTIVKNGPKNPISEIELPINFPCEIENGLLEIRNSEWPHYHNDAYVKENRLLNAVKVSSGWSSKDLLHDYIKNNLQPIYDNKGQETTFIITRTGNIETVKKRSDKQSHVISVLMNLGNTQSTSSQLRSEGIFFDYPKPVNLIKYFIQMNEGDDFIVMDFFAGIATTAQSILELNEIEGNRKFIIVQMPEPIDENTQMHKAGYETIADMAKSHIQKVIARLENEKKEKAVFEEKGNFGFKAYKLSPSNFKQWQSDVQGKENLLHQLEMFTNSINSKSEKQSIITELLLKSGKPLTTKVKTVQVDEGDLYFLPECSTYICLESFGEEIRNELYNLTPKEVIVLSALFKTDEFLSNTKLEFAEANIKLTLI